MTDTLTKLAYQTFQQGKRYFGLTHKTLSTQISQWVLPQRDTKSEGITPDLLLKAQQRLDAIVEIDWQDAERGVYPIELLFDNPWEDFFRYYPMVWLDLPLIWDRVGKKQYQKFSPDIETEGYPSYYVQNFHHQTDGYLSEMSANLYDLQVELLFNGAADAMRRRILAPLQQTLAEGFTDLPPRQMRILDVATGTGRTLRQLRGAFPKAALYGMDLSPAYLRKANQLLSGLPGELPQLCQANAEELPYPDRYFHAVTCVFLFHELPAEVRQRVIEQAYRVLQPGGTFVICDSVQTVDTPEFQPFMENFQAIFHEPYHRDYSGDDLSQRLEQAGFSEIAIANHFMSKYWVARKR
jgi:ubiquinone/menaquinone biosynthesis C-methylase UbiE